MGYGCPIEDTYGWCYRTQQGCGTRVSPHFSSFELAEEFHDFLGTRADDINTLLNRQSEDPTYTTRTRVSLYTIPLWVSYFIVYIVSMLHTHTHTYTLSTLSTLSTLTKHTKHTHTHTHTHTLSTH